jgi:pimeloyl-ACP methyl ester carboxylesterase
MRAKWFVLVLALTLTACQGGSLFHFGPSPTPFPEEYSARFVVGDFELTINCLGHGEPTILLEHGLGGGWDTDMLKRFSGISRTCVYERPRVHNELDMSMSKPRTTLDQVKDLHALLQQSGVPGPYILAGHSIAGFNMTLYTNQFPHDVLGLVCIDCRGPQFSNLIIDKLNAMDLKDPFLKENLIYEKTFIEDWTGNSERLDIATSEGQVNQVTSLKDRPFVVLVASDTMYDVDGRLYQLYTDTWREAAQNLCDLSSQCRLEVVQGVNHGTILQSEAVDKAVKEVFDAVTKD